MQQWTMIRYVSYTLDSLSLSLSEQHATPFPLPLGSCPIYNNEVNGFVMMRTLHSDMGPITY